MHELDRVAQQQFGAVTRRQAVDILGSWRFRRAVDAGQLVGIAAGVYRAIGTRSSFRQRALAACLAYGPPVAVSYRSAAVLWGYELVVPGSEIEVSIPRSRSGRQPGIRAHRVELPDIDVEPRFGIPVTCTPRTLLDLAGSLSPYVLERCVDDALRARHATARELFEWLGPQHRAGRRGAVHLYRLLERRHGSGVADSVGVDRVRRWIVRAGLPAPVVGLAVTIAGRPRLLDLAYPEAQVAIEFNGWEYHQMRSRMDEDHARTNELQLAGWLVLVVTAAHSEAETVDRIARALAPRTTARPGPDWGMLGR